MRLLLLSLVAGVAASAQPRAELNQQLRAAAGRTDTLVLSVLETGDGAFVYDLPGEVDARALVFNTGAFIVRAPGVDRALVVVEPYGPEATSTAVGAPEFHTGLSGPNVAVLTPAVPVAEFRLRQTRLSEISGVRDGPIETYHRVRVLVCTDGRGADCQAWASATPRSGGGELYLVVVDGPPGGRD